jgi:uncharacterized membrane protein
MAVGIVVAIIGALTPNGTNGSNGSMMGNMNTTYGATSLLLVAVGMSVFAAGLVFFIVKEDYEPVGPEAVRIPPAARAEPVAEISRVPKESEQPTGSVEPECALNTREEYLLILRLLVGDERSLFRAIIDSNGEALQKDLIVRTKMSHAKVSRVIDRLEQKGVITKERFGATNKVRIKIEK